MLKYVDTKVVFQEIPDEITLAINISNCPCNCKGCHSSYLAKDIGKDLTQRCLERLISENSGITCISFMGGDAEPKIVNMLAEVVHKRGLLVGWYSGRESMSPDIDLKNFDYIKLGPYIEERGPLDNPNTNQRLYKVVNKDDQYFLNDITSIFWNK